MIKNKKAVGSIVKVQFPNKSIVEVDGKEYKLKGGILGQKVEISRTRRTKAKLLKVLEKSPIEDKNNCPHLEECGGCTYQSMAYDKEIEYKEKLLKDLFEENSIDTEEFKLIKPPHHKEYRNKMEYTFSDEYRDGPLTLGLHKKNKFYEVVNTDHCNIVHEDFNIIRKFTREYLDGKYKPYNKNRREGVLRHLLIRRSSLGEILVNLVTTSGKYELEEYFEKLLKVKLEGKIVSLIHTENDSLADAIVAEKVSQIYGRDYIMEEIHGLKFKVSCFSFFQTNTDSAQVLYSIAKEYLGDLSKKTLLDLYSGTGTITQILGQNAKKALGIEIVEEAVDSARENVKINKLSNIEFICGDVFEEVKNLDYKAEVIVLDPPREGINPRAINKIIDFAPETFLYISCNPLTLVRDLQTFKERGYKIVKKTALDQFPRTYHVECIVLLTKIKETCEDK